MDSSLKYANEQEKCFGMTGMAISIVALDAESMLESMSLDGDADDAVKFTADFYFSGNPRFSARLAWKQILEHYQLLTAMAIGNLMCRNYLLHNTGLSNDVRTALLDLVSQEGHDTCSLDDDEINSIFTKSYNYLHRLFTHHGVQTVAREFAATLSNRRQLSRSDVIEELRALAML